VKEECLELVREVDDVKQNKNALEVRYKTLLQNDEEKWVQAEVEHAEWKRKVLDVEFQLSAKDDEISVWEQKYNLELLRTKTTEEKMIAMEEELEERMAKQVRDSERIYTLKKENKKLLQKFREEMKGEIKSDGRPELKYESRTSSFRELPKSDGKFDLRRSKTKSSFGIEDFTEDPDAGKVKTKFTPKNYTMSSRPSMHKTLTSSSRDDPTKMEEDDEEARDSFHRARMFFAAQERAAHKPDRKSRTKKS